MPGHMNNGDRIMKCALMYQTMEIEQVSGG